MNDFRWDVRVAGIDGDAARIFVRKQQFDVGLPISFDPEYERTSALEYLLGALGADVVCGLRKVFRRRRLELDGIEAAVQATLDNPLTHIGVVGEAGHPGVKRVSIRVYVSSLEDPESLQEAWQEMLEKSPLLQTLRPCIQLELQLKTII